MHEVFGIDCDSPELALRNWRWLRSRILSLADRPPTFFQYATKDGKRIASVPSTRLGYQMNPPVFE